MFWKKVAAPAATEIPLTSTGEDAALDALSSLLKSFGSISAVAMTLLWGDAKGRIGRLLIWSVALVVGIMATRNTAIALLSMMPVAFNGFTSQTEFGLHKWNVRLACGSLAVAMVIMVGTLRDDASSWGIGVQWNSFPRDAAAFVKQKHQDGVVFNNWDCGGYLDWAWGGAPPTFLDGRLGSTVETNNHDAIVDGGISADAIKQLGITTILIQPLYYNNGKIAPGVLRLLSLPEWHLVRASDALVFMREPLRSDIIPLQAMDAWHAVYHHIESIPSDQAYYKSHLAYSRALALYFSGDISAARLALANAKRNHPELLAEYQGYFLFKI